MKKSIYIKLFVLLLLLPSFGYTQTISKKKADKFFKNEQFAKAINIYENLNRISPDNLYVIRQLAYAYNEVSNYKLALNYFKIYTESPQAISTDWLNYARLLKVDRNYVEASKWYQKYLNDFPNDNAVRAEFDNLSILNEKQTPLNFTVRRTNQNTPYTDMCPVIIKNQLLFSSSRDTFTVIDKKNQITGQPFLDIYRAGFHKRSIFEVEKFSKELNTSLHDGPIAFSIDGKTIFITRNSSTKSRKKRNNLKIYIAHWDGTKWINEIEFPHNSNDYSVAHPAISNDGNTLYFSSNMPGGFGETDIYKSTKTKNGWSEPINLGRSINTTAKEMFPTIDQSNNLFFSSNTHTGYGGLDIFIAEVQDDGSYLKHNLGNTLNSSHDDFHIVFSQPTEEGFFTSNRPNGEGHDDIYFFSLEGINFEFEVKDSGTQNPIADVVIQVKDKGNNTSRKVTNEEGKVQINLKPGVNYAFRCSKKNYFSTTNQIKVSFSSTIKKEIVLLKKRN